MRTAQTLRVGQWPPGIWRYLRLQRPNRFIIKGSLSLLNQNLGDNPVRGKTFETGPVPEYPRCSVAQMDNGSPVVLFMPLLFLPQCPAFLSVVFIISQTVYGVV